MCLHVQKGHWVLAYRMITFGRKCTTFLQFCSARTLAPGASTRDDHFWMKMQEKHEKLLKSMKYCVHCCALCALFGAPGVEVLCTVDFIFEEYIFFSLFLKNGRCRFFRNLCLTDSSQQVCHQSTEKYIIIQNSLKADSEVEQISILGFSSVRLQNKK